MLLLTRRSTTARSTPTLPWWGIGLSLLALAFPVRGDCPACGPEPRICTLQIHALRDGERRSRPLPPRETVRLSPGEKVLLELEGIDQHGRSFPSNRAGFALGLDRRCPRALLRLKELAADRFELEAGSERGRCELVIWVPGNLNLEWSVPIEVRGFALSGYSRAQAETIATHLYRALLGREPDPEGLAAATSEIQRGRLLAQIQAMVRSGEYAAARAGLGPSRLLEEFYRGLLERAPDSSGVQSYLSRLERGDVATVVFSIVRSEEFEERFLTSRG